MDELGFRSPASVRYPGEQAQAPPSHRAPTDRSVLWSLLAVAAVPSLMVTAFLFGRWSAETPTIVPAPKVYVVPADALAGTTSSSVAP